MIKSLYCKRVSGVAAFFEDEHKLLEAAHKTYQAGYRKFDSLTPFPVHGMDDAMGLKRSFLPWVTLGGGLVGGSLALWFQWWTSAVDWPLNIGGKPLFSWPAFVPIIFELTVLIGALSTFGALLITCGLPKIDPPIIDPAITSHKFCLFVPDNDVNYNEQRTTDFFKSIGAVEIKKVAEF